MGMLNMPAPSAGKITAASMQAKMHLNPLQQQQMQRIVVAGLKVMFSQQSHGLMLKQLQGPDPLPQKIGMGIAGLLGLLQQESKGSIPPQLIIPAGIVLLCNATDWLRKAGTPVSDEGIGNAIQVMTSAVMRVAKLDPDKVAAIGARGTLKPTAAPGPGQAAAQPAPVPR